MSLVAPWFLAGLAALALPLWLHRLHTRNALRAPFSSAMLLERSAQQQLLHRRWRYRTLLGLRVLLLAALCCAFAQPRWRAAGSSHPVRAGLQLIVLDTSLSMNADGRFARARAAAERIIDGLGGARALIVTASDGLAVSSVAGTGSGSSTAGGGGSGGSGGSGGAPS
ncbi:MAG: BatA domain-containing protein, partial [Steroidobacteraceae bacterium]